MVLNEQFLKRKRIYFHGSKYDTLDISKSHFDYFFVSCDITTAILYCKKDEDGIEFIHTFMLEKPLNIFNAKSKVDYEKLKQSLLKKGYTDFVRNDMWQLEDNDWHQLETDLSRDEIVGIIKGLGYDGFFNFEWDIDKSHSNEQVSKPSIGLFDIRKLVYTGVQPFDRFRTNRFDDINRSDIRKVKSYLCSLKKRCHSDEEYLHRAEKYYDEYHAYYSTLTKKDFFDIARNTVKDKIDESMVDFYEKVYQESSKRQSDIIGLKVPPKEDV